MLDLGDIQGLVFSGYARAPQARYFRLLFGGVGAAEWLSRVLPRITTSERRERGSGRRFNVAFTASGLRALGLPESALATFPAPFLRGMHAPELAARLGDHDKNSPKAWEFGGSEGRHFDALVLSYAATATELDDESDVLEDGFERFGIEAEIEDVYLPADQRGHFGFLNARTNPSVRGGPGWWRKRRLVRPVAAGEFVLGYKDATGHYAESPVAPVRAGARALPRAVDSLRAMDLGRNGTFLALRKVAQDVAGFWRWAERIGAKMWPDAGDERARRVAEAIVGRTRDGEPLGPACPVGAHAERARHHPLIRRGRLYGPKVALGSDPDDTPRGLMFIALCADLERQFGLLYEAGLNNPKFGGLTHERDPLVGMRTGAADDTFSLQGEPFRRTERLEPFVRVRGGAYLFMPGLRALSYLAEGGPP